MIRLFIIVLGLFLIWVLFFSSFTKQRKVAITVLALVMCVIGVWLESNSGLPKSDIIAATDIGGCGVVAKHSYRSNFDLQICLRNNADDGEVKLLGLSIIAQNCTATDNCLILETVQRRVSVSIAPNSETTFKQNLSFDAVDPTGNNVVWSVKVDSVQAVR